MQHIRTILIAVILVTTGLAGLKAQTTFPVTGGNATGSKGSVSWSVGQVLYNTYTGTNGSVAQGVQQPFEIMVVSAIEEAKGIDLSCIVYPNPTKDVLRLKMDANTAVNLRNLSYLLYDINGKQIKSDKLEGSETIIETADLAPAIYILKVIQGSKEIKTFKIIKN